MTAERSVGASEDDTSQHVPLEDLSALKERVGSGLCSLRREPIAFWLAAEEHYPRWAWMPRNFRWLFQWERVRVLVEVSNSRVSIQRARWSAMQALAGRGGYRARARAEFHLDSVSCVNASAHPRTWTGVVAMRLLVLLLALPLLVLHFQSRATTTGEHSAWHKWHLPTILAAAVVSAVAFIIGERCGTHSRVTFKGLFGIERLTGILNGGDARSVAALDTERVLLAFDTKGRRTVECTDDSTLRKQSRGSFSLFESRKGTSSLYEDLVNHVLKAQETY